MKRTLNTTINRSKNEKYDEHYTQLADIEDKAVYKIYDGDANGNNEANHVY